MEKDKLLKSMGEIVDRIMTAFKSDFDIDKRYISNRNLSPFVWHVRDMGTHIYFFSENNWHIYFQSQVKDYKTECSEFYHFDGNSLIKLTDESADELIQNEIHRLSLWHGKFKDLERCLVDVGLICRLPKKTNYWEIIYKINSDVYKYAWFTENDIKYAFSTYANDSKERMVSNGTWNNWNEKHFIDRISEMVSYYGSETVLKHHSRHQQYTLQEICESENIKANFNTDK